eukprot:CAMPEP_0197011874 /NCGR_PEP_ID=MMETSP1380-20130617/60363_1 /TAXON_ID=5936 /ORGANISM="Euplotes crassus, Strain CT5" /LENGTH=187 /DNA_ID=CAMNT_0042434951 /DNA_START=287 /DNA_END=847 /DNA_ORIENTATION=+
MPWVAIPYKDPRLAKIKQMARCQSLPWLTVLRKDGSIATYDGISLINNFGITAFNQLMKTEGGFMKTYEPLKVAFDYFGILKDKYKQELDANDEENKDKWDDLPIRPGLAHSAMKGELPPASEHPYDKETFVLKDPAKKAPINYDDMVIPTVATQHKKAIGTYEEQQFGGLKVTEEDIAKQPNSSKL